MSLICDTPEETIKIVNANLKNVQVVQVKNGFEPKEGKEFDPTQYADIKMILLVGSGEDYQQEELVEVQIIQRINLELKKFEHKLYDFIREQDEFIRCAEENNKLLASLESAKLSHDIKAADHLSSSSIGNLLTIQNILFN